MTLFGVLFATAGIISTGIGDYSNSSDDDACGRDKSEAEHYISRYWGDVASAVSAVGYGAYSVAIRYFCPKDEHRMSMEVMLGYVGLIIMVTLVPLILFISAKGTIDLSTLTFSIFSLIMLKALLDNTISDYLLSRVVILTGATVASVGLGLTIPFAFVSDMVMGRWEPTVISVFAAICVFFGFAIVTISTEE